MRKYFYIFVIAFAFQGLGAWPELTELAEGPSTGTPPPNALTREFNEWGGRTYRLFVHGLHDRQHCDTSSQAGNKNGWKVDVENYWTSWDMTQAPASNPNQNNYVANLRYIGFNNNVSGGAYAWGACGAQSQLNNAIWTFCGGVDSRDDCEIFTHSTGGLVLSAYLSTVPNGYRFRRIVEMASAVGGSELADLVCGYNPVSWAVPLIPILLVSFACNAVTDSVSTHKARATWWNHNQTYGKTIRLTSSHGQAPDSWAPGGSVGVWLAQQLLPGFDDTVLSKHTTCAVNHVPYWWEAPVTMGCPTGNGIVQGYYRYTPYWTQVEFGTSRNHGTDVGDWMSFR